MEGEGLKCDGGVNLRPVEGRRRIWGQRRGGASDAVRRDPTRRSGRLRAFTVRMYSYDRVFITGPRRAHGPFVPIMLAGC
jgi:hypothetical protein